MDKNLDVPWYYSFIIILLPANALKSGILAHPHNGMVRSQDLFWWKWLTGQALAALNYISNLRVMEQSGADQNGMGGIPSCLGAHNTSQNCPKMHLDMAIPNSLI